MSKSFKIILLAGSGFVALLISIAVALVVFVDVNAYKPRLEATASAALGMEVRIDGRLGIGFFPGLLLTLRDVHILNRGSYIVTTKEARIGVGLLSLLRKEVQARNIMLKQPVISIERDSDGTFNFEKPDAAGASSPALDLAKLSLSDASFLYVDKQSVEGFEAGDCSLVLLRLHLSRGQSRDIMQDLSFTGSLDCGELRAKRFAASDLKVNAEGRDGVFDFKSVTMDVFGTHGSGNIRADFSGATPVYNVRYSLPGFQIKEAFKTLSPQQAAEGTMDFSANLTMQGNTVHGMKRTLRGQISLQGENLILIGTDLDKAFSRYESSQNFNLVDLAAFFYAGPFGLVVTKGYNFASIFQGTEGSSSIHKLVSNWKVERGQAQAQDVAMVTNENRVALQGRLNFVSETFDDVFVALIDARGCAKVQQEMHGTFHKPVVEKPTILQSLSEPTLKLLRKGRDYLTGAECDVFYSGSVAPPK
jgi:AsmA protein